MGLSHASSNLYVIKICGVLSPRFKPYERASTTSAKSWSTQVAALPKNDAIIKKNIGCLAVE